MESSQHGSLIILWTKEDRSKTVHSDKTWAFKTGNAVMRDKLVVTETPCKEIQLLTVVV
jgi:hypothetical protein